MQKIEYSLSSLEVAEMLETEHWKLLRKLEGNKKYKGIITVLTDNNFVVSDFFIPSTYSDSSGKENKCYKVTKKGCEFLANKFTGEKGVLFTARYINRFHEMEDIISRKEHEPELPWFIRKFRGEYVVLERDFIKITGVDIKKDRRFYRESYFTPGVDWNGFGEKDKYDTDEFKQEYGFEYGDDSVLTYLYPCGVLKALSLLADGRQRINPDAYKILTSGFRMLQKPGKKELAVQEQQKKVFRQQIPGLPVQINIIYGTEKV